MNVRLVSGAVAAILAGMATATSAADLRFTTWSASETHLTALRGLAESFVAENPGNTVTFETIPFGDYVQKLTLQLAGGNPPDMGWMVESSAPTFLDAGVLADVTDAIAAAPDYDLADYIPAALELWTKDERLYGIPFSTSPFIVYYNADMFAAAGLETPTELAAKGEWTWDAFKRTAAALTRPDDRTYGYTNAGVFDNLPYNYLVPLIRSYGGEVWTDAKCTLDAPEAVTAVTLFHDMVFKDKSMLPPGESGDFQSGKAALTLAQLSAAAGLDKSTFRWALAPLPSGPSGQVGVIGQAGIVVFAQSHNAEVAKQFLVHMTKKGGVESHGGAVPAGPPICPRFRPLPEQQQAR